MIADRLFNTLLSDPSDRKEEKENSDEDRVRAYNHLDISSFRNFVIWLWNACGRCPSYTSQKKMTPSDLERAFRSDHPELIRLGLEVMGVYEKPSLPDGEGLSVTAAMGVDEDRPVDPDSHYLSVQRPFLFDHRRIPSRYGGLKVQISIACMSYWPKEFLEFETDDVPLDEYWDPQKFVDFVEREADLIRNALEDPSLTKQEMLDIFAFGDFEEHKRWVREKRLQRLGIG